MKNLFAAISLGVALVGVSTAQQVAKSSTVKGNETRIAVVEFTPGPNASGMTDAAKRLLQTSLSASLANSRQFDVYDTRHTRNASQADLASVNGTSTAAAVRVGKLLGVNYVLTGTVIEYNAGGTATVKLRVVEVGTGKVRHASEASQHATMKMTGNAAAAETQAKVMKPLVLKLTDTLLAVF